jgi:hypothetical protein
MVNDIPWGKDGGGIGEGIRTGKIVRGTQFGGDCNIPWLICVKIVPRLLIDNTLADHKILTREHSGDQQLLNPFQPNIPSDS